MGTGRAYSTGVNQDKPGCRRGYSALVSQAPAFASYATVPPFPTPTRKVGAPLAALIALDELPRSSIGKVLRRELQQRWLDSGQVVD